MIKNKPGISTKEIREFVDEKYGLKVTCFELEGERDQNFLIKTVNDNRYVLKVTNPGEEDSFINAQVDVLNFLSKEIKICPLVLKNKDNQYITKLESVTGANYRVRIVSYFQGYPLGELKDYADDLLAELGNKAGTIDKALSGYDNAAFRRYFMWDLSNFERVVDENGNLVKDKKLKSFINSTVEEYLHRVRPVAGVLRKSIIHNDINDFNIIAGLREGGIPGIKGIIDFGDMVYGYTVADPAVVIAYLMLQKEDPLRVASVFTRAYNKTFELQETEISVLFTMARMRLALSICIAARQQSERPDDKYLAISQGPIKNTISKLESIHPLHAETVLRIACGKDPVPHLVSLSSEIEESGINAFPVMGEALTDENIRVLSLGVGSRLIESDAEKNDAAKLGVRIKAVLEKEKKKYGIGRYVEPRILYSSDVFQKQRFSYDEDRTVHLGMDIFAPEYSPVYAPIDGLVHRFSYNPGRLDYGNMIILSHRSGSGNLFYTLYGHLASKSLTDLEEGKKIRRGEVFAWLGNENENGGWSPHLHFQILTHLLGYGIDYPGVCRPWEVPAWKLLSPNPNLLLNIPDKCFPGTETEPEETARKRKLYFPENLSLSYSKPVKIVRGWKQYLYDSDGLEYIDAYNNVPHIGHSHPEVIEAACRQMRMLNTNTRYLSDHLSDYAELLLSTFEKPLEVCFFLNSASEANELALRLAFTFTGARDVIVLEGAYHGNTNTLIDISPYKHDGPGGYGPPGWVHTAPVPDLFRGEFKYGDDNAGKKYAQYIEQIIDILRDKGKSAAAFIAETCPSVGGQIIFPEGYLDEVYRLVRSNGGVCIADEVQTSYGRMGSSFYAYQDQGVIPDIVVLGKPIGNGHPLAAVITTRKIAESFNTGMEFFSTFGGNTVSAVTGRKVLEIVLRDGMMRHAHETGTYLINLLKPLKKEYPLIGDIRGAGLFLGVELVRDKETLEPAGTEAQWIKEKLREMKILIGTDGPYNNVLKIRPPMPFGNTDADILADRFRRVLKMFG